MEMAPSVLIWINNGKCHGGQNPEARWFNDSKGCFSLLTHLHLRSGGALFQSPRHPGRRELSHLVEGVSAKHGP